MPAGTTSLEVMLALSKMWSQLPAPKRKNFQRVYARERRERLLAHGREAQLAAAGGV